MTIIETINADFKTAFKGGEKEKKDFLGVLKTEVTRESKTPDDAHVIAKIKSMIKNGSETDSLSSFELDILNEYLPSQMSEETLKSRLEFYISDNKLSGMQNMGKVMGFLKENFNGQYDGGVAAKLVKELLA